MNATEKALNQLDEIERMAVAAINERQQLKALNAELVAALEHAEEYLFGMQGNPVLIAEIRAALSRAKGEGKVGELRS